MARTLKTISLSALLLWSVVAGTTSADAAVILERATPTQGSTPSYITIGSDGLVWFTENSSGKVGRIDRGGVITEFPTEGSASGPLGIAAGPDGNLWVTQAHVSSVAVMSTDGALIKTISLPPFSYPFQIATGPDGNLWVTENATETIDRINSLGEVTGSFWTGGGHPTGIAAGSDGNVWFATTGPDSISRMSPDGEVTRYPLGENAFPLILALGPDGNMWFTENAANKVGRITPSGVITEFPIPTPYASPVGITPQWSGPYLWFVEYGAVKSKLARIDLSGHIREVAFPTRDGGARGIVAGPGGRLFFTEPSASQIGYARS